MKTHIVKIGNSQGIRIPKVLLEDLGLTGEVELSVRDNYLVVRSSERPRAGWEEQFKLMAQRGDDKLLDNDAASLTKWDADQWQWK